MFYAFTKFSPGADVNLSETPNTPALLLHSDLALHQCGNGWMVVSPKSGGWCILDRNDYDLLAPAIKQKSLAPLAEYLSYENLETILGHMTRCGLTSQVGPPRHSMDQFSLTLLLSNTCNLACRYCYLSLSPQKPIHTLSVDDAIVAMNAAFNQPLHNILIDFGEIAVHFSKIQQLVAIAEEFASAYPNKQLQIAVQTNGTSLTKKVIDFIKQHRITVGISLDGPETMHDAVRVTLNNRGSHASCEAGLRNLIEQEIPHIVLCTISAANVRYADVLVSYFLDLGVADFSLKPVIHRGSAQMKWEHVGVSVLEYNRFLDDLVRYAISSKQWNALDDRFVRYLFRLIRDPRGWSDACPTHACGSGSRMLIVNPYGHVFPCPRFASIHKDAPPELYGNLSTITQIPVIEHYIKSNRYYSQCIHCPWFPYCDGGCRLEEQDSLCNVYSHMYNLILTTILPNLNLVGFCKSKLGRISVVNEPVVECQERC